jgi:hypothetical protein
MFFWDLNHWIAVMENLGESQFSTTSSSVNSVVIDLIYDYLFNNMSLEGFIQMVIL